MVKRTFEDLTGEMFNLYRAEKYQEAYDLLRQEAPHFPQDAHAARYFLLCLATAAGHPDEALRVFQESLDQGEWFAVDNLREDPDLASLQGQPEFERLVGICRERAEAAQAAAKPTRLVLPAAGPEHPGTAAAGGDGRGGADEPALLVALHGNEQNARVAAENWRPATAAGWTLALPQSSQVWGSDAFVWNDRDWGSREVLQQVAEVRQEVPAPPERTVLAGFSAGGGLVSLMALSGALDVAGFFAVGPWVNDISLVRQAVAGEATSGKAVAGKAPGNLRGYIVVGEEDQGCLAISREIAGLMQERGMACELEIHPNLGHEFPKDFPLSLERGLRFIMGSQE